MQWKSWPVAPHLHSAYTHRPQCPQASISKCNSRLCSVYVFHFLRSSSRERPTFANGWFATSIFTSTTDDDLLLEFENLRNEPPRTSNPMQHNHQHVCYIESLLRTVFPKFKMFERALDFRLPCSMLIQIVRRRPTMSGGEDRPCHFRR